MYYGYHQRYFGVPFRVHPISVPSIFMIVVFFFWLNSLLVIVGSVPIQIHARRESS